MPEMGSANPGGGGQIFGLPTKYVLLGGGGLVVAFLMTRGGGSKAPAVEGDTTGAGQVLGPNASLALGDLSRQFGQKIGETQELQKGYFSDLMEQLQHSQTTIGDLETSLSERISDADFWQTAQRRGELANIRASVEQWSPLRRAQESAIYAQQMISMRPDLEAYFRNNWEASFGDSYNWGDVVSAVAS